MRLFLSILGYVLFVIGVYCIMLSLGMAISELSFRENIKGNILNLIIIVFVELLVVFSGAFLVKKNFGDTILNS